MDVSLNKGLASITLSEANTVTMKQLQDAIKKNGFVTKESNVIVSGQLLEKAGSLVLVVSGSNEELGVTPSGTEKAERTLIGKSVTVEGTLLEFAGGSLPPLRSRSITESK